MKKYFLFIFCLFVFPVIVHANTINSIDMDIFIDDNGNAKITEIWDAYLDSGSEGFHSYGYIGKAYISDLSVSMNGKDYEIVDSWNVDYSMSAKEYSAYIGSALPNEYGVYFGISRYGNNKYTISYTINNFIVKLKDANMLYWNLVPRDMGNTIGRVDITVSGNKEYSKILDVWGYGKYGALVYVDNGKIYMKAENVTIDEYMTLLVKYPVDMFNPAVKINKNFNYYLKKANKGAVNYNDNKLLLIIRFIIAALTSIPFLFIAFIIFISLFFYLIIRSNKKKKIHTQGARSYQNNRCDFGDAGKIVRDDVLPYRDIPTDDIFRAFWIIYNYNLGSRDENMLGALLLKWINDGYIRIEKESKDNKSKIEDITNIVFIEKPDKVDELEKKLYGYFYQASIGDVDDLKNDNKLTKDEFSNWCKNHIGKILDWFADSLDGEVNELVKEKKINVERVPDTSGYDLSYKVDSSMMEEAEKVAGLKKFLEEFSIVNERDPLEVKILDKYLIYATMFGIADKVYDKFKDLYPDLIVTMCIDNVDVNYVSNVVGRSISYARSSGLYNGISGLSSSSELSAFNYSGGGGGFSSGGGGFGSFGSGSSGGFR